MVLDKFHVEHFDELSVLHLRILRMSIYEIHDVSVSCGTRKKISSTFNCIEAHHERWIR